MAEQAALETRPCASKIQRLRMIKATISDNIDTDVAKVEDMLEHGLGGGKGLRALVAHISADWCGMSREDCNEIAAAMEMIHVASLLHDDIVDNASMRRHRPTVNVTFGADAAVLAGDFLYSRASQLLCRTGTLELLAEISDATNKLAEGEVLQLTQKESVPDKETYFDVIGRKTAALFAASALAGPAATGKKEMIETMRSYGWNLGLAFQIADDCLDYEASEDETGKAQGMDFLAGKTTLPFLLGLELANAGQKKKLLECFEGPRTQETIVQVIEILEKVDAIQAARDEAQRYSEQAVAALEQQPTCNFALMLATLARKAVKWDR